MFLQPNLPCTGMFTPNAHLTLKQPNPVVLKHSPADSFKPTVELRTGSGSNIEISALEQRFLTLKETITAALGNLVKVSDTQKTAEELEGICWEMANLAIQLKNPNYLEQVTGYLQKTRIAKGDSEGAVTKVIQEAFQYLCDASEHE